MTPLLSVIISTYNSTGWLKKVLWGYQRQSFRSFELIIADDGSDENTALCIAQMKRIVLYPIQHLWQTDRGFRKTTILNKAIVHAQAEYLVFSDGDCIPRDDFLEVHWQTRKPGYFLSGGYLKLPVELSQRITSSDILSGICFDIQWLKLYGLSPSVKNMRLTHSPWISRVLNALTPTKSTWNGHNASAWKKDLLKINGFDERMAYGGEDRELGERLENMYIRGKQIRYSAICLHLEHTRGYISEKDLKENKRIRGKTHDFKLIRTPCGILKEKSKDV
ncbi:glycosyltransferase family 2 protein [Bacteroidetes bacterium endosymbiont of Geopemphigus sp.]|uniref:glycosyltransferase family 2 protein n=1 Tax=Bacteroidetes bacterium endosymbiont of Geopemphigus sp. TaxID=2047937 RepID=UPI000CD2687B|nr:glycosyltransferase family 2 protein [Bacteroidetes bacterium endosymbiont of Geopemphigus sp.]